MIRPVVADMAHFNTVSFPKIKAAGIIGVIHKASQGVGMTDGRYASRRPLAEAAGILWGAYSFATADDAKAHARHFLAVAKPDKDMFCCLDYEDPPKHGSAGMSAQQAWDFMREVEDGIGRMCWIYSGNRAFEHITPFCHSNSTAADYFKARPLWLAQYKTGLPASIDLPELNKHIRIPGPWSKYTLLQYTGDGIGPQPHTVDGLEKGADLNAFDGSDDQLRALWAGAPIEQTAPSA